MLSECGLSGRSTAAVAQDSFSSVSRRVRKPSKYILLVSGASDCCFLRDSRSSLFSCSRAEIRARREAWSVLVVAVVGVEEAMVAGC